jgi:hypothetical protein
MACACGRRAKCDGGHVLVRIDASRTTEAIVRYQTKTQFVDALKIVRVAGSLKTDDLMLTLDDGSTRKANAFMANVHPPVVGDYFVIREDGRQFWTSDFILHRRYQRRRDLDPRQS